MNATVQRHRLARLGCPVYNAGMSTMSIQDIQRDPQGFVGRVVAGETILVVRGDRPVAEVRPVESATVSPRPFGLCADRFFVPEDFNQPLADEILKEFEGS